MSKSSGLPTDLKGMARLNEELEAATTLEEEIAVLLRHGAGSRVAAERFLGVVDRVKR